MSASHPSAVIDVGSNTVRLLVAVPDGEELKTLLDDSAFVRLGLGVERSGVLDPERSRTAVEAIERLAARARDLHASPILSVATSAVREARNRDAFVREVRDRTGVEVEVISGEREAELTYRGAMLGVEVEGGVIVCDLGGGSAELIHATPEGIRWALSQPLGSGRLTERFVEHDPPTPTEQETVRAHVSEVLDGLPEAKAERAIFTGGTARHIVLLAGLEGDRVSIDRATLDRVQQLVCSQPAAEIVRQFGVDPNRAAVLPAGITALQAIAEYYGAQSVVITRHGIREGTLIDFLEREGEWPSRQT